MNLLEAQRIFTVDEYYRMAEAGILHEDDRVELIEGRIVELSPIGGRHAACVDKLNRLLNQRVGDAAIVRVQNPVSLPGDSEPEPDIALLRPREDFYAEGHPGPEDVFLIIEVAETSLGYDRGIKAPLYARAGVPELWIVDLESGRVLIHGEPSEGVYGVVNEPGHDELLVPRMVPELSVGAGEILG